MLLKKGSSNFCQNEMHVCVFSEDNLHCNYRSHEVSICQHEGTSISLLAKIKYKKVNELFKLLLGNDQITLCENSNENYFVTRADQLHRPGSANERNPFDNASSGHFRKRRASHRFYPSTSTGYAVLSRRNAAQEQRFACLVNRECCSAVLHSPLQAEPASSSTYFLV